MSVLKMVLKDSTEVELSQFTLPIHVVVVRDTKEEVMEIWDHLTQENLEEMQITEDGETFFTFHNCAVTGEQIAVNPDGTVTGHYYLSGERQAAGNAEYETAAKILMGEVS